MPDPFDTEPDPNPAARPRGACIPVVAAVIRREERYLVCRRPQGKRHAGLWEFPGGKLGEGETLEDAVARELREELGVTPARVGDLLHRVRDPGSAFEIHFVAVEIEGTPRALEHDRIDWCGPDALLALGLAPADRRFVVERLCGTEGLPGDMRSFDLGGSS